MLVFFYITRPKNTIHILNVLHLGKVLTDFYPSELRDMQAQFPKDKGIPILIVRSERSGLEREVTIVKTVKESQGMNMH